MLLTAYVPIEKTHMATVDLISNGAEIAWGDSQYRAPVLTLIVRSETPPLIYGISLIGIILFLAAAIMGIWLLVAILKKGRL